MISASALLVVALTTAGTQPTAACQLAIKDLSAHLPELSATATGYSWRGLPTVFQCDDEGAVQSVSVHWQEGRGLLGDARSAIAAFGSKMTGDTATAVRGAFDRCLSAGGRAFGETIETTTGGTLVTCTVKRGDTVVVVRQRRP
jgi:hypothetical protein